MAQPPRLCHTRQQSKNSGVIAKTFSSMSTSLFLQSPQHLFGLGEGYSTALCFSAALLLEKPSPLFAVILEAGAVGSGKVDFARSFAEL